MGHELVQGFVNARDDLWRQAMEGKRSDRKPWGKFFIGLLFLTS